MFKYFDPNQCSKFVLKDTHGPHTHTHTHADDTHTHTGDTHKQTAHTHTDDTRTHFCALVQAVSRRCVNVKARVQSEASQYGICGGQIGTGTYFLPSTSAFSCQYNFTGAPSSFVHLSPTLCKFNH
jgi:hypothetical protein